MCTNRMDALYNQALNSKRDKKTGAHQWAWCLRVPRRTTIQQCTLSATFLTLAINVDMACPCPPVMESDQASTRPPLQYCSTTRTGSRMLYLMYPKFYFTGTRTEYIPRRIYVRLRIMLSQCSLIVYLCVGRPHASAGLCCWWQYTSSLVYDT